MVYKFRHFINEAEENTEKGLPKELTDKINSAYDTLKSIITSNEVNPDNYNKYVEIKTKTWPEIKKEIDAFCEKNGTYKNFVNLWDEIKSKYDGSAFKEIYCIHAIMSDEKTWETEKKSDLNIDDLKKEIETDKLFTKRFMTNYDKLVADYKKAEDKISNWVGDDENKLELYTNLTKKIEKYGDDILPKLWLANAFVKSNNIKEQFNFKFNKKYLFEDENPNNKELKELEDLADQIQTIMDSKDFAIYDDWKSKIDKKFEAFGDKIKDKDKLTDPVQKLSAMGIQVKNELGLPTNGYKETWNSFKKELDELDNIKEMNDITKKLQDIDSMADATYKDILNDIPEDKKADYDKLKIENNDTIIKKLITLKAIMAKLTLKESFERISLRHLIVEDEENKEKETIPNIDEVNKIKEDLKNILNKDFTKEDVDKAPDIIKDFQNRIQKLYDGADEERKKRLDEFKDIPYTLLYAMGKSNEELDKTIGSGEAPNEVEEIKKNLPEEEAKKALDNMVVNVKDDKIDIKTTFNGWKGEPDKLDVYIYSDKDIDQQIHAAASPFYHAYQEAYRDLFDKWCEETEKGTDENKKKAIPLLKKLLGDKVEEQPQNTEGVDKDIQAKFDTIKKEVEELKKTIKKDEAQNKLETIESQTNKTLEDLKKIITDMPDGDKKKTLQDIVNGLDSSLDKEDLIKKLIYTKAIMAKMSLKESVVFNNVMKLLFEAEESEQTKALNGYKEELFNILNKDFTEEDIKNRDSLANDIKEKIKKAYETMTKEHPDKKEELDKYNNEPIMLLYAMADNEGSTQNEEVPEDLKKNTETLDKMIQALSDHTKDNNFVGLIDKVEEQNKKVNEELGKYLKEHPDGDIAKKQKELVSALGDIASQTLPALWAKNFLLRQKDANESWNRYTFLKMLLNEAEEESNDNGNQENGNGTQEGGDEKKPEINAEELTKKAMFLVDDSLEKLMSAADVNAFKTEYSNWIKNIDTLIEEIKKANNEEINKRLDELANEDPLKKAASCVKAIEALAKKPEEGGEKQEGNQETGQEGGQESNKEGENNQQG